MKADIRWTVANSHWKIKKLKNRFFCEIIYKFANVNKKLIFALPFSLILLLPFSTGGKSNAASRNDNPHLVHTNCLNRGTNCSAIDRQMASDEATIAELTSSSRCSAKNRERAGYAYNDMATIYIFHFYDYGKALDCLIKARAYYGDHPSTALLINFAHLANFYSECLPTEENRRCALEYYHQAFRQAVSKKEWKEAYNSFNNVCCMDSSPELMQYNNGLIDSFNILPRINDRRLMDLSHYVYRFTVAIRDQQWDKASGVFHEMLDRLKPSAENSRFRAQAYNGLAKIACSQNHPDSLLHYTRMLEETTRRYTNPDIKKDVSLFYSLYYKMRGDSLKARLYKLDYFEQRDSMLYQGKLAGVRTTFLSERLQNAGTEMDLIRQHLLSRNIIMAFTILWMCIIVAMLVWVYRKNQELKQRNLELYRHNISTLKREKEQQEMLRKLEQSQKPKSQPAADKPRNPSDNLSEEERVAIRYKIEQVMNDASTISKTDFSIDQLAQRCNMSTKVLSRVINETFHRSFSILLSESRIKEACNRINDFERYGNLTIEAISQSVGFSSRGGFIRAFKRTTGLTPSEYLVIARKQSKNTKKDS